jgi:hypothetical protein
MKRAAISIDILTVRLIINGDDLRAEFAEKARREF